MDRSREIRRHSNNAKKKAGESWVSAVYVNCFKVKAHGGMTYSEKIVLRRNPSFSRHATNIGSAHFKASGGYKRNIIRRHMATYKPRNAYGSIFAL
jgi:hypothetical protein